MSIATFGCPWAAFERGTTTFCEASLCSWIESPGIAWAGWVYVAVGISLWRRVRSRKSERWVLNAFPVFAVIMGLGSFFYHSSHAFVFQVWDVGGMFLLGTGLCFLNLEEAGVLPRSVPRQKALFLGAVFIETMAFILLRGVWGPRILGGLVFVFLLTEIRRRGSVARSRPRESKYLAWSLLLFALGGVALWTEHRSGLCDPDNHVFQWHAVWDIACAFTYATLFHYFESEKTHHFE